jgi:hypothetical protein
MAARGAGAARGVGPAVVHGAWSPVAVQSREFGGTLRRDPPARDARAAARGAGPRRRRADRGARQRRRARSLTARGTGAAALGAGAVEHGAWRQLCPAVAAHGIGEEGKK